MVGYCDGGCLANGSKDSVGYGSYALGDEYPTELEYPLGTTSNEAEYLTLIALLEEIHSRGLKHVQILTDSQLVVFQVTRKWKVKANNLKMLCVRAQTLSHDVEIRWVPREVIVNRLGH